MAKGVKSFLLIYDNILKNVHNIANLGEQSPNRTNFSSIIKA